MTFHDTVLATLAYADVFDYPLTKEEIGKWLIKRSKVKRISGIENVDGYFFLKGRKKIVSLRKQRKRWVKEKMQIARRAAGLLKIIPTIQLIGVTGALAMENAHRNDDIDFYIVTRAGTLWTTRFFATALLALFGLRRNPGDTSFRNKICLNMYVDEQYLAVRPRERDLFAAHEVLQMKPLWDRGDTYNKFLNANEWVKFFLPNAWDKQFKIQNSKFKIQNLFRIIEPIFRVLQQRYMKKRKTTEVISSALIRFHPHDARVWVKDRFGAILARYNIPLDKIFYAG